MPQLLLLRRLHLPFLRWELKVESPREQQLHQSSPPMGRAAMLQRLP